MQVLLRMLRVLILMATSRPYGNGYDIGAYEYGTAPPLTETVSTPIAPVGPESGTTGTSYSYSTGGSSSSLGHPVEYQFDWQGDGTDLSPWGSSSQSKAFSDTGSYSVKARARCQNDPAVVSSWSDALTVTITAVPLPDLTGEWVSLVQSCRRGKCKLIGSLHVQNIGEKDAPSSSVSFYLSADNTFSEDDTLLKQLTAGKLKTGARKMIRWSISLPAGVTASGQYVIAVVDSQNVVLESNENNNQIAYGPLP